MIMQETYAKLLIMVDWMAVESVGVEVGASVGMAGAKTRKCLEGSWVHEVLEVESLLTGGLFEYGGMHKVG